MSSLLGVRNAIAVYGDDFERLEATAQALARAVDAKGDYLPSHCQSVAHIAYALGARVGIEGNELARLRFAGLLHDVGKLFIPDEILLKPGKPTELEWDVIREHPVRGYDLLLALGLRDEARWVLHHHERLDGSGYPTGLHAGAIPLASRILGIADAFDVITHRRVYKAAGTVADAFAELHAHSGTQFDGDLVDAFADVVHTLGYRGGFALAHTPSR